MADGAGVPSGWPLLMTATMAARFVGMTARDFRAAVAAGLVPAGRTAADLAGAGLLRADRAPALEGIGPLWHRAEIETHTAHLWGLDGRAAVAQAHLDATLRETIDAFDPTARAPAARHGGAAR
jgi:hypothetical protein